MAKDKIVILGVDPGTVVTGFGLVSIHPEKMEILDFGCIRPPAKKHLFDRYLIIHEGIETLLTKYQPTALAIETQFVDKNPQSAIKLGMARGVIIIAARKNHIPVFEYTPKKAKLAVTGNGQATKKQVQTMIQYQFALKTPPEPEDAADAISIAVCHAHASQARKFLCMPTSAVK